ncbi:hypothetical protein [Sphingomonas paucimobilis]|uniref:Uncharacterized protein n=1 Tax=Sphingomonas paucimobilis TaxID=13689 RepID=A0A7Y2KLJ5_SPHPI|nr:hypothetical protein [Sphingomonas paucimobilis]
MKTKLSGSRSSWPSNHSSRRFGTSVRSCSVACAVFCQKKRHSVPIPIGERRLQLDQRDVILRLDRGDHPLPKIL